MPFCKKQDILNSFLYIAYIFARLAVDIAVNKIDI